MATIVRGMAREREKLKLLYYIGGQAKQGHRNEFEEKVKSSGKRELTAPLNITKKGGGRAFFWGKGNRGSVQQAGKKKTMRQTKKGGPELIGKEEGRSQRRTIDYNNSKLLGSAPEAGG